MCSADVADGPERVDCRRTGRSNCGDDAEGGIPGGDVRADCLLQRFRLHRISGIDRNLPQVFLADARDLHRLFNGGVCFGGAVHGKAALGAEPMAVDRVIRSGLACRQKGAERGCRSGVLDDAGEARREPDHFTEPLHHALLELCCGRRSCPAHALSRKRRGEHLGKDRRSTAVGREVGEERRILPVRHPRHDNLAEVIEDRCERLPFGRRVFRKPTGDGSGLERRLYRIPFDMLEVVRHPIDEIMGMPAKLIVVHYSDFFLCFAYSASFRFTR